MSELTFVSLSFQSEEISKKLGKDDGSTDAVIINAAKEIIQNCLSIESSGSLIKQFSKDSTYSPDTFTPLIFEVFHSDKTKEIILKLKKYDYYLNRLENEGKLEPHILDQLVNFFADISEVSYKYSKRIVHLKEIGSSNNVNSFGFSFN